MPSPPNLFAFATSELTQDAVLCWLLAWADERHASADVNAHRMGRAVLDALFRAANVPPPPPCSVVVKRQDEHVDIVASIGSQHVLAIEDKIHTSEHSGQLSRYAEQIGKKYSERTPVFIYLKTGGQCSYEAVREAGWTPLTRKDFLAILRPLKQNFSNAIFIDFLAHIEAMDAQVESYRSVAPSSWSTSEQWKGFYNALQQSICGAEWDYVANPSGGFMGYWWAWTPIYGGQLYLQLEENSLVVKVMASSDDGDARSSLRNRWVERMVGLHDGLRFDRPARLGHGKYMTVAVYHGDYRAIGVDGLLDCEVTVNLLQRAARAVGAMGLGDKSC